MDRYNTTVIWCLLIIEVVFCLLFEMMFLFIKVLFCLLFKMILLLLRWC